MREDAGRLLREHRTDDGGVPVVTMVNCAMEILFERKWSQRLGRRKPAPVRLRDELLGIPIADPLFEITDIRQ